MRVRCVVPDCGGIIETPGAASTVTAPCPECTKRVQVMPRMQEQIRALQTQVIQLQSQRLAAHLPLLRAIAKKSATTKDLAASIKQTPTGVATALLKLEKRGLVVVAEFRRLNGRAVGTPLWGLSSLGERVIQESGGGATEMRRSNPRIRGLLLAA